MKAVFERVVHEEDVSFACHDYAASAFDCPYHVHPEIEILHVQAGSGSRVVGDHISSYSGGELLLLGPNLPHMFVSDPAGAAAADALPASRSRYVQFLPDCIGPSFFDLPELRRVRRMLETSARGIVFVGEVRKAALISMDELWNARGANRIARLVELLELLATDDAAGSLATPTFALPAAHHDPARLAQVTGFINDNLLEQIRLNDVADLVFMSPQAFSRFFRRHMGQTFIDYVISLRVGRACRMLIETDRSTLSICYDCGFRNVSNFNRQFLRLKGLTPRAFRQQVIGG